MGQGNDRIEFEEAQENDVKRVRGKGIFGAKYTVNSKTVEEKCQLPVCRCPAEHEVVNEQKLCSVCTNQIKSFRKNEKLNYVRSDYRMNFPAKPSFSKSFYQPGGVVEEESNIYYYNAWSLPTQKCFADRDLKNLTETQVTEVQQDPYEQSDNSPSYHPMPSPHRPYNPPKRDDLDIDYSQVDTRNRYQNFFMTKDY